MALTEHDVQQSRDDLLAKNASTYFPIGADEILYDTDHKYNPQMIVQQPDERWISESPRFENTDLPGDGFIKVGSINNITLFRLHRPDQASDGAFYHDSKAFIDMALKGLDITRQVGSDSVRVTSLSSTLIDDKITDKYGRVWQRRVWPLPYLDAYVMAMILPTPDGYDGFFQYGPSLTLDSMTSLAESYANLIDMSYWGTIAQWQSFLKQRDLVPEPLAHLQLNDSDSSLKISFQQSCTECNTRSDTTGQQQLAGYGHELRKGCKTVDLEHWQSVVVYRLTTTRLHCHHAPH